MADTGFPIKDARFSTLKHISALLSEDKVKLMKISIKNILAIGRLFRETLYSVRYISMYLSTFLV